MYDPKSELSLFNDQKPGTPVKVSSDFYDTMLTAKKLYDMSDGSWQEFF
ncbi:MAG: FAD:protein FMN transferase [Proteobacteria bacterium]|nr:FAD:protein FMN transferase [Pseudomonadota bacterium]MBU1696720.1 FAD:protein FMN transferase [Pseudomonadota bacterium]